MAEEIHELAVRLRPEGAERTQAALDDTSETFEQTADTADAQTEKLSAFASKWKGAMGVIVTGLGVAASGLLAKVPVVGESMAILIDQVELVALAINEDLRPSLTNLNEDLLDVNQDVAESDSAWEAIQEGILGTRRAIVGFEIGVLEGIVEELTGVEDVDLSILKAIPFLPFFDPGALSMPELDIEGWNAALDTGLAAASQRAGGFLENWQTKIDTGLGNAQGAWDNFAFTTKQTFTTLWGNLKTDAASGLNDLLEVFENRVNDAIELYNEIPLVADKNPVSIGRVNVPSRPGGREGGDIRLGNQADRQRNTFADRQRLEVSFSPSNFERFLNARLNQGPENRGRQG